MYAFLSHKSQPLEIDIAAAEALLRDGEAYLLDVRQGWEWRRGHVQGAIHVPLDQLPTLVWKLPRDKPLAIICQHGERSLAAAHFLAARDFEVVASVAGGTVAWARSGRALVRD